MAHSGWGRRREMGKVPGRVGGEGGEIRREREERERGNGGAGWVLREFTASWVG